MKNFDQREDLLGEEELIHRSQAGDWDAFEQLLERHRTVLARTAYLTTRDRESVQDVMQEALVQVWRDLSSYRPYGSFRGWMLKILLNKARKHYRKKQVQTVPMQAATEVLGNAEGPEKVVESEEQTHRLRQALDLLTRDHREALILQVLQRPDGAGNREGAGMPGRDHQVAAEPGAEPPRGCPFQARIYSREAIDDARETAATLL